MAPGAALVGRHEQLHALQRAAADRVAVRLVSPRRFGKTSLLRVHLAAMGVAGHRACRQGSELRLLDPLLAEWLRRQ